jgi:hypothetical protein
MRMSDDVRGSNNATSDIIVVSSTSRTQHSPTCSHTPLWLINSDAPPSAHPQPLSHQPALHPFHGLVHVSPGHSRLQHTNQLALLHTLAQLVPDASPDARFTSGSKPKDKREQGCACILLTNLEPDKWVIHISHLDGGWWNGTWRIVDVEKLAVCASTFYPSGWRWQSVLSLHSQSGNMLSAHLTVYASPMIELGYAIQSMSQNREQPYNGLTL